VVEALFRLGDQLALRNDDANRDVLALIEELGGRILQNPVLLDHIQEAIFREAEAVRQPLWQTRREFLDLDAALSARTRAIGHRPDLVLAGADEGHDALRADRHVARVGNKGVELNVEPGRQFDLLLQNLLDGVRLRSGLRDGRPIHRRGHMHALQSLESVMLVRR
jgi:hypothetical protein